MSGTVGRSQTTQGHVLRADDKRLIRTSWRNVFPAEYKVWQAIKNRCLNSRCAFFDRYGGRGIKVYESWINDHVAFITYVRDTIGLRPSCRHSLDRINNEGHYEPGNLKWSTYSEQNRNRRRTNHTGKLDRVDVDFIVYWLETGHSKKDVANAFSVNYSHIWNIEHGKAWVEGR